MKIAIMQPYFFPYLGYFDLINKTEKFIIFDIAQYRRRSWMNRNRILSPNKEFQYITAAINKVSQKTEIKDVTVKNPAETLSKTLSQITHYKKNAPYYADVVKIIEASFESRRSNKLSHINVAALKTVCAYLKIPFNCEIQSEIDLIIPETEHPGQSALYACKQLGAKKYYNPPNGIEIFKQEEWNAANIELIITSLVDFEHKTPGYNFIPHLSILDLLMWNSPEDIAGYLARKKT
jgi:hypothetical protein